MEDNNIKLLDKQTNLFLTTFKTYKTIEELDKDARELEVLSVKLGYSLSSASLCLPLGIHLLKERKRLVGLTWKEKKQLTFLKAFNSVKKNKIKKSLGLE